ncbi:hypothetical protein RFN28_32670 [Mesorhizobium sp. VK24D]|uniref:Uncharacterized protein n=1 Tax=Mesorhizobium album TaxID=3072314 RepID=A0ABU4Y8X7_9HYPH|nr:hypothetical protein [Mesorhizobium sp. VK24D]MDX8483171.1 hypothetical protein [Mesorhizobium sp. VK24D]
MVERFLRELATQNGETSLERAAELFRSAAKPFLERVWPQELSLVTPGVSSALADLPAAAGNAFAEAVDAVGRFLVPFECWSLHSYGLRSMAAEANKLAIIDSPLKARALLKLLDLTIGSQDISVIPNDLGLALERISELDKSLEREFAYQRLTTAARR